MAKAKAKTKPKYTFQATAIEELRRQGVSWANVAAQLGLKSPGAARQAYTDLTGRHHNDIEGARVIATRTSSAAPRAPKAKANGKGSVTDAVGTVDTRHFNPGWNADTDQDEIIARLVPGTQLVVERRGRTEELQVQKLVGFEFSKDETRLAVGFHDTYNGAYRCVYVDDIVEVY